MCIGIPMQVLETGEGQARCRAPDGVVLVDTRLVGAVVPGSWLMVFLGAAREILSETEARQTLDALTALEQVMRGQTDIDHLFADLVDREPTLPEALLATPGAIVRTNPSQEA